jgi:serine/threonine protein kinase
MSRICISLRIVVLSDWIVALQFGPYEIQSPIGAGGMGEVYRARDTKLGRNVAIKVISAGSDLDLDRPQCRYTSSDVVPD